MEGAPMNRWRQRLDEIRDERQGYSSASPQTGQHVQNVQNVQNTQSSSPTGAFEHFEHFEQRTESGAAPLIPTNQSKAEEERAALAGTVVIAPAQWFEREAVGDEPPYDQPCLARRGVIRYSEGRFEHFCTVCGAWGAFGFEVTAEEPGRWYCFRHRAGGIQPQ
jgi:hypothetical protein